MAVKVTFWPTIELLGEARSEVELARAVALGTIAAAAARTRISFFIGTATFSRMGQKIQPPELRLRRRLISVPAKKTSTSTAASDNSGRTGDMEDTAAASTVRRAVVAGVARLTPLHCAVRHWSCCTNQPPFSRGATSPIVLKFAISRP